MSSLYSDNKIVLVMLGAHPSWLNTRKETHLIIKYILNVIEYLFKKEK